MTAFLEELERRTDALLKQRYAEKLAYLGQTWQSARERAEEHHDVQKACIEAVKLETLREIRALREETEHA